MIAPGVQAQRGQGQVRHVLPVIEPAQKPVEVHGGDGSALRRVAENCREELEPLDEGQSVVHLAETQEEAGDQIADAGLQVFVRHHYRSPEEQPQQLKFVGGGEPVAGEAEEQGARSLQGVGQLVRHALLQVDGGEVCEEGDEERRVREAVHADAESLLVVDASLRRGVPGNQQKFDL